MNFAGIIGLISMVAIAAFSILTSTKNKALFLDAHAIIIVIGGTLTVALLSFSFKRLFNSLKIVTRKMFGKSRLDYLAVIKEIVELSNAYRTDPKSLTQKLNAKSHPFLVDGIKLISDYGFKDDELEDILDNAVRGKRVRDQEEVKVWQTISRFPPAFGLLGATLGMIALLQTIGEPGAQDRIGPAMATALVATFYGLMAANLVLLPIAEKLSDISSSDLTFRSIVKEGVILISQKKHPQYIEEYLKSFLSPNQRKADAKSGGGGAAPASTPAGKAA